VLAVGAALSTAKKVSVSAGSDDGPAYSPDGKWLAWRSQKRNGFESDKFDLVVMDRGTGAIRDLTEKFGGWVDEFHWVEDSQHLLFASAKEGAEPLFETNVTGDSLSTMAKGGGEWSDFSSVLQHGRLHVVGNRVFVDRPSEIFNVDLLALDDAVVMGSSLMSQQPSKPGEHTILIGRATTSHPMIGRLTHLNDALVDQLEMSKMEPYWFAGANGTKVEGFVVRPPGFDAGKKYPVKFLMHGGPQGAWGDGWSYRWNPELFAADGYVVVMVNPRGSTGYGQQFVDEVSGDWGGRPYVDLMKGLDAAEAKFPFIDKTRECALGASYGGFMANWVLTHTDRFKCIVTHDGMYDPVSAFGATEELWFNEWEFRPLAGAGVEKQIPRGNDRKKSNGNDAGDAVVEQEKAARPWDFYGKPANEDPFRKWSPMMFIKDAKTPTLVVHSQKDYRLDVSQGLQLYTALQLLGVPSKMLYFPDEGHWVTKPQNAELWWETVDDWCDRWTGMGKYAAVGPEKNLMAGGSR